MDGDCVHDARTPYPVQSCRLISKVCVSVVFEPALGATRCPVWRHLIKPRLWRCLLLLYFNPGELRIRGLKIIWRFVAQLRFIPCALDLKLTTIWAHVSVLPDGGSSWIRKLKEGPHYTRQHNRKLRSHLKSWNGDGWKAADSNFNAGIIQCADRNQHKVSTRAEYGEIILILTSLSLQSIHEPDRSSCR